MPIALVEIASDADEGQLIRASSIPWLAIADEIARDPEFLFQFLNHSRNFEEFIAACYATAGYEVVLTPQSADRGRDVIATVHAPCSGTFKIYDQVMAYRAGNRVTADDVRAAMGVLSRDQDVSKAIVTTSSQFAPGVYAEYERFMPGRLLLRDGNLLRDWILELRAGRA